MGKQEGVMVALTRRFARATIPVVIVCTVLMSIPLVLIRQSKMCGPSYIELGYENATDSSSHYNCGEDEFIGTNATILEDASVRCELGASSIGVCVLIGVWPFLLLAQAYFLNARANGIEAATKVHEVTSGMVEDVIVAKVYDDNETAASAKTDKECEKDWA